MRTLVVWCPDWPVTAMGFGSGDRVAVLEAGRVVVASAAARAAGVQVGSRRREAESRCPGLVVRARDPAQEARAFEPVVAAVAALTPQVEITRPDLLALDARGPTRYFGGQERLCRRVAAVAGAALADPAGACTALPAEPGVAPSVLAGAGPVPTRGSASIHGMAPTAGAAGPTVVVMAGIADGRFAATLAARRGVIVPPGENAGFLAPFPVSVLGRPELADLLGRLGLCTLGDLAGLPETAVVARFGADAGRAHALARGLGDQVLRAEAPGEELAAATELDPPADRAEMAAFVARSVVADLLAQLERRGLVCTRVRIEAETEHGEVLSRQWRGTALGGALDGDAMVERLRWQLDGWLSGTTAEPVPTAGIIRLALAADEVAPAGGRQLGLWGGASDVDRRAARGLDRLRGILGPDAVGTAALVGGRGPADRVTFVPWGEPRPDETAAVTGAGAWAALSGAPTAAGAGPWTALSGATAVAGAEAWAALPEAGAATVEPGAGTPAGPIPAGAAPLGAAAKPPGAPPWPGRHPWPAPAIVHHARVLAQVTDAAGTAVTVSARGRPSAVPARISVDGGPWTAIVSSGGPWTADERWWDPGARRRLARFQVLTETQHAYLCLVEDGRWWVEATYD